jgi:hypothetical protein
LYPSFEQLSDLFFPYAMYIADRNRFSQNFLFFKSWETDSEEYIAFKTAFSRKILKFLV